ncbi:hypothetical protein AB205_0008140, partial [Aquarana catesbeiana]
MLHGISRIIRGGAAVCRHTTTASIATGVQGDRQFSVAHQPRDYSLPNATWSPDTKRLYEELSRDQSWRILPSYNTSVHYQDGMRSVGDRKTRLFTRNLDQDGVGFEYCMFYNQAEKRTICIFQPGPYLEGPRGLSYLESSWFLGHPVLLAPLMSPLPSSRYAHGGCIATIIDATVGTGTVYTYGPAMTANLNIDYRNPIPLGSTVIIDSRVEKVDGRKIYSSCQVRSHDDAVLHNEAT